MPYADAPGQLVRVTIAFQMPDSQIEECNMGFICSAGGGGDSRLALGDQVYSAFATNWIPIMSALTSGFGYKVSTVGTHPPPLAKTAVGMIAGGVGSTPPAPTQARPVLSWGTAMGGKGYRGRLFLPTPSVNACTAGGFILAGVVAAGQALGTQLLAPITVGGTTWNISLIHRHKGPPITFTSDPIISATMRNAFGTQRKSGNYGRVNSAPW